MPQLPAHMTMQGIPVHDRTDMAEFLKSHDIANLQQAAEEQREMQEIKDKAIADGTFMKAPNGKSTNLNERQWLQVRTKAFKNWFGDWMNDPANASKIVDENGEPLVVYRGGNIVDGKLPTRTGGYYFTPNEHYASKYTELEGGQTHAFFLNARSINNIRNLQPITRSDGKRVASRALFEFPWTRKDLETILAGKDAAYSDGEYLVSNPNSFKSATDNIGTFSTESDDIQMAIEENANIFDEKFAKDKDNIVSLQQANVFLNNLAQLLESGKQLDDTTKEVFNEIINKINNGEIRIKGTDSQVLGQNRLATILTTLSRFGNERYRTSGRSGQVEKTLNLVRRYLQEVGEWQEQIENIANERFGKPSPKSGVESKVYLIGDYAMKLQSLSTAKLNLAKAVERILRQNKFDPTCQTEIIGVGQTQFGEFMLLLRQPHIKDAVEPLLLKSRQI